MMIVVYNMEAKSHLLIANLRTFFEKYEIYLYEFLETRKWRAFSLFQGRAEKYLSYKFFFFLNFAL
jgi:hypothetical protein